MSTVNNYYKVEVVSNSKVFIHYLKNVSFGIDAICYEDGFCLTLMRQSSLNAFITSSEIRLLQVITEQQYKRASKKIKDIVLDNGCVAVYNEVVEFEHKIVSISDIKKLAKEL